MREITEQRRSDRAVTEGHGRHSKKQLIGLITQKVSLSLIYLLPSGIHVCRTVAVSAELFFWYRTATGSVATFHLRQGIRLAERQQRVQ